MFPEKLFKLLQVAIVVKRLSEAPLAVLLPMRKELLAGVPLLNKEFALLFRFQGRYRLRTIAVDMQRRNTSVLACPVQRPRNFVFRSRTRLAAIRHLQGRGKKRTEARPKETNHQIKFRGDRDRSGVSRVQLKFAVFQKMGTEDA